MTKAPWCDEPDCTNGWVHEDGDVSRCQVCECEPVCSSCGGTEKVVVMRDHEGNPVARKPCPSCTGPLVRTIRDPHHDGESEWRWDGTYLYHRSDGQSRWVKVRRVSFTPARILALAEMIAGETADA